ncbi:hypothetical protein niasHT_008302 [Heterodera trifolii]|uniref:Uncharacterized protein n=1 Tax=Heterodera trifolii TaxID=157864 RepID=A0ABD2M1D4_9BILA
MLDLVGKEKSYSPTWLAPKRAAPKRAAPKRAAPKRAAPKRAAPKRECPGRISPPFSPSVRRPWHSFGHPRMECFEVPRAHHLAPSSAHIRSIIFKIDYPRALPQFTPSILFDCPLLRSIASFDVLFPVFWPSDSANAWDGQAVAKWLLRPRPDGVPKMLRTDFTYSDIWKERIDGLKTAFANASSSPAQFIIILYFRISRFDRSSPPLPFNLINNLTGERLTLAQIDKGIFLLVRCPLVRDESKWANWEREAKEWPIDGQMNTIIIGEQEQEEESEDDGHYLVNLLNTG